MQFTTSKSDIFEVIQKVLGVVPAKTTIPILSNLLFELSNDILTISGTDLEISISSKIKVKSVSDGAIAIPARMITDIIRELPDVPLDFLLEENDWIKIQAGRGLYRVAGQPRDDFPKISMEESEKDFNLTISELSRFISKTIFAISSDELRPALTGVYLEILENELRFVGTDGHRLSRVVLTDFKSDDYNRNIIIPSKTLNLLMRSFEEEGQVNIKIGKDHIIFGLNNTIINSKLIDSQYPNYERVIPNDNDKKMVVNKDVLHATLRRSIIFSNSLTHQVRFDIAPSTLTISAEDIEYGGESKEEIPIQFDDENMALGYNAAYLIDVLRHLDTEEVIFELKNSGTAAIIYPTEQKKNENLTMLLMPMRLTSETEEEQEDEEPEDTPEYE